MRCAYLILAHRYPAQLARLAAALLLPDAAQSTGDKAFIHIDQRADTAPYHDALQNAGLVENVDYEVIEQRVITAWGDFSLVQAALNLIRVCWQQQGKFDYLSLLSGQDYPLTGASERKRRLAETPGAEHLSWFTLPHKGWALSGGLDRVRKYHNPGMRERIRTSGLPGARYFGAGAALLLSLLPRNAAVPGGLTLYGGWQWWTLTSAAASYVMDYADRYPALVRYFKHAFIPDELFFQTVLMNSPLADRVTGDYLRYVQWDDIKPHVFDKSDLQKLRAAADTCLFARKFELVTSEDAGLLDILDLDAGEECSRSGKMGLIAVGQSI